MAEGATLFGLFVLAWMEKEEASQADTFGASQYRRCHRDWLDAGKPEPFAFVAEWLRADDAAGAGV